MRGVQRGHNHLGLRPLRRNHLITRCRNSPLRQRPHTAGSHHTKRDLLGPSHADRVAIRHHLIDRIGRNKHHQCITFKCRQSGVQGTGVADRADFQQGKFDRQQTCGANRGDQFYCLTGRSGNHDCLRGRRHNIRHRSSGIVGGSSRPSGPDRMGRAQWCSVPGERQGRSVSVQGCGARPRRSGCRGCSGRAPSLRLRAQQGLHDVQCALPDQIVGHLLAQGFGLRLMG